MLSPRFGVSFSARTWGLPFAAYFNLRSGCVSFLCWTFWWNNDA